MCVLKVRLLALVMGFAHATFAADILIADAKSQPESLTAAPGGVLIVGSASTPYGPNTEMCSIEPSSNDLSLGVTLLLIFK
jgi:hypothetical protein